jgi:hypothetical protein
MIALPAYGIGIDGTKDSADFANKYEADVLPDAAGLGFYLVDSNNVFADTVSLSGGVLTINTDAAGTGADAIWYQMDGGLWNPHFLGGFTAEIRAKVNPGNSGTYGAALGLSDENSTGFFQMFFDHLDMEGTVIPTAANNDDFHVFRVTSISDGSSAGQVYRVYRDGVQVGSDVTQITSFPPGPPLRFGDFIAGFAEVNFDIDYIRWDTTGAWAPVPEPASLGLLLAGSMVMTLRGRRGH